MAPHTLVSMVLEIEHPSLTPTMIDFLVQEEQCLALVSYLTQVFDESTDDDEASRQHEVVEHPEEGVPCSNSNMEEVPAALILLERQAERSAALLVGSEEGEALLPYLRPRASAIAAALFAVFDHEHEDAFFDRACEVLRRLFRAYPDEVYAGVLDEGDELELFEEEEEEEYDDMSTKEEASVAPRRLAAMLGKCSQAPVCRALMELLTVTTAGNDNNNNNNGMLLQQQEPRQVMGNRPSASARWQFVRALARWRIVDVLAMRVTTSIDAAAAAALFAEALDALCRDANGEVLLQPLIHCGVERKLVRAASDGRQEYSRRLESARALSHALRVGLLCEAEREDAMMMEEEDELEEEEEEDERRRQQLLEEEELLDEEERRQIGDLSASVNAVHLMGDQEDDGQRLQRNSSDDDLLNEQTETKQDNSCWACELVACSSQRLTVEDGVTLVETRVGALRRGFRELMVPQLPLLCDAACEVNAATRRTLEVRHPGRYASVPFTQLRLELIEMIVTVTREDAEAIAMLPLRFWTESSRWFFETFPETTLFQRLFVVLLRDAFAYGSRETLGLLLGEVNILGKLIDAVLDPLFEKTRSIRPHALHLCDFVRLSIEAETNPDLAEILSRHDHWRDSCPKLIVAAQEAARLTPPPPPEPLFGEDGEPLNCAMMGSEVDVGLGSPYARALGFGTLVTTEALSPGEKQDDEEFLELDDMEEAMHHHMLNSMTAPDNPVFDAPTEEHVAKNDDCSSEEEESSDSGDEGHIIDWRDDDVQITNADGFT